MALYPTSKTGRVIAALWLAACVGMLFFAWRQRHIHDMPEAFFWLMIFLSFPAGYVAAFAAGVVTSLLFRSIELPYHPFWEVVPVWIIVTSAGYAQWFVLVPAIWRRIRARPRAI